jgi:phosphoglycolate phosphatase
VLFDLDGTLLDTFPGLLFSLKKTHAKYIGGAFNVNPNDIRETVSLGRDALVARALNISNPSEEACIYAEEVYSSIMLNQTNYFDGIKDVLSHLISIGLPFGIVTSKPKKLVFTLCDKNELLGRAAVIICPEDVKNKKPNPEPLIMACQRMNIDIDSVIYVGDSDLDIKAANSCNMASILALYGYLPKETDYLLLKPTYTIKDPLEMIAIINAIRSDYSSSNAKPWFK